MMKPLPNASLLRDLLDYNARTGVFMWKPRRPEHFTPTPQRDAEWLCKWWNKRFANTIAGTMDPYGYIIIRVNKIDYMAHRIAWVMTYGVGPNVIDHINGIRGDNRLENLRSVQVEDNTKNAKIRNDNISGITGVSYFKPKGTWRARINYKGKTILLGYFRSKEAAIAARRAAETVYEYHENHGRRS